jgi:transcriptional regulator with XRE-family HTH domain
MVESDAPPARPKHRQMATPVDWTSSSLGERIKYTCQLRGISLNELGEAAGMSSGPLSRYSRNAERIAGSPEHLAKVAEAGRVSVLWLIFGRGPVEVDPIVAQPWASRPEWPEVLDKALRRQVIPDEFWALAGRSVIAVRRLDWELVAAVAWDLYAAHLRSIDASNAEPDATRIAAFREDGGRLPDAPADHSKTGPAAMQGRIRKPVRGG